jgi:hypothetical protein
MKRVVIESPLAGDFQKNFRYALWCAYDCRLRGESPYASHLFFPLFLNDLEPEQREFGITAGYAWSQHADVFAFYIDLSWSVGMERAKGRWTKLMQQGPHPSDKKIEHPSCWHASRAASILRARGCWRCWGSAACA